MAARTGVLATELGLGWKTLGSVISRMSSGSVIGSEKWSKASSAGRDPDPVRVTDFASLTGLEMRPFSRRRFIASQSNDFQVRTPVTESLSWIPRYSNASTASSILS